MSLRLRCTLVVTLACAALSGQAWAQDPEVSPHADEEEEQLPVSVRVHLGYGEKVPHGGFSPIFVDLTSPDANHVVSLRFLSGVEALTPLLELGPVSLTKGQPRRVRGIAPSRTWFAPGPITVEVTNEAGEVVGRAEVFPEKAARKVLLVVDRHAAPPTDFSALEALTPGSRKKKTQWEAAMLSERETLPVSPLGYTGLTAVLLGDLEFERWSEDQAEALAGWVAQGGSLFLSIGKRGPLLRQSLLGRKLGEALAPIPFDRQPLTGKDVTLGSLLGNFGPVDSLSTLRPPYASPLVPGEGDIVRYRDDTGRPFVVQRRHGEGSVTLVASDLWSPPFLHSRHVKGLVQSLLGDVHGTYRPPGRTADLFHELASIRQPAQVGPAFALLIIFALVAGPGVYFLLRAKKRGILLWAVIPALTLGFTALVPFYRLILKDAESTLVGVRLQTAQSGGTLSVETLDALIFSGGLEEKRLSLRGESVTAYSVLPPRRMRTRGRPRIGPVLGGPGPGDLVFDLPIALWGTRYVSFSRTTKRNAISGSISLRLPASGEVFLPRVNVKYDGAFPLKDAVVVFPSKVGALIHEINGDLRRGMPYSAEVPGVSPASTYESPDRTLGGLMITRLVAQPYRARVEIKRKAYLIGHSHEPLPIRAEPNVRVRASTSIVVVELPLQYVDGVPMGLGVRSHSASTVAQVNTSTVTRELRTKIRFPNGAARKATQLTVKLVASRGSILSESNLQLYGLVHGPDSTTREAVDLGPQQLTRDKTGRSVIVELQDPARWLSPEGHIELIQVFDRPRVELDQLYSASIDASVRWAEGPR